MYKIQRSQRFKRAYKKLNDRDKAAVKKAITILMEDPSYPSLRSKKMKGVGGIFEASPTMNIRLTYHYEKPDIIYLRNVGEHDQTLKNP